ncbi:cytochrome P450 [Pseudonocardia nigra]|uniref:cytochrome P450 n=1 Tax=Pseudonocardia nigra TaxID=1921578 RepID=UPI001C5FAE02|nr:cytochrome P450 [Pseudonocardia nigra]
MPLPDDLLSPEATADPHAVLAALREHDPVHWSEAHRAWLLTRYDDVSAAFQNKALSNDRVRPLLAARRGHAPSTSDQVLELLASWMVVSDPPAHTRLRKLAGGAFKAQRISAMDAQIERLVDDLLDTFVAGAPAGSDLISDVAYPLPATVIATMLGAPVADRDRFRDWSDELALVAFGTGGEARADRHERALRGLREMDAYFRDLIAVRRRDPGEDMLTAMMATDPDDPGDRLADDELVAMCALLLFAGHETTTNSIANATLALLRHPDQLELLRDRPDLLAPAVEELLRFDGPIKVLNRWVVAETEIAGCVISPGQRVHLVLAAANRDPARFDDPDRLDLTRSPNPHVAFGKGIHACIGAQLARMETRIAVGRIVARLPGMRLAGEPVWKDSLASRSLEALPVAHDAGRKAAVG